MTLDDAILQLVEAMELTGQSELQEQLRKVGHRVTQSTLSRHLKKLGIQKVAGRYQRLEPPSIESPGFSITVAKPNLLVINTRPGHAQLLAVLLDENRPEHVAGTLAGDDTVLVVVTAPKHLADTAKAIRERLSGQASA